MDNGNKEDWKFSYEEWIKTRSLLLLDTIILIFYIGTIGIPFDKC